MKKMLNKNLFIDLLTKIVSASNYTNCVLLSNQKCMIQPNLKNLHPNKCIQEFHYYCFAIKLDRCVWICDLSNKARGPNKTKI